MPTIKFIEKESFTLNTLWDNRQYYPCYMIKDGTEVFLWNRDKPSDRFTKEDIERRKRQLIENNGAYFKFYDHSGNNSPNGLVNWGESHKYTFREDYTAKLSSDGITFDFHGNLNECSCAFFYRIYDHTIMNEIKKKIIRLIQKTYLDSEQLKRLYEIFLFEEDENICAAWLNSSGRLFIEYESPSGGAIYEPMLEDEEGKEKLDYILDGNPM